jgi:hypothetical protein
VDGISSGKLKGGFLVSFVGRLIWRFHFDVSIPSYSFLVCSYGFENVCEDLSIGLMSTGFTDQIYAIVGELLKF